MENQKSKKGLIAFLIVIILLLITALGLLLGGVIKNPFIKETTSIDKTTKTTKSSDKNDNTLVEDNGKYIFKISESENVSEISGGKIYELGNITLDGKNYKVKYELIEDVANNNFAHNLYFNDTKLEVFDPEYIAVMDGKYLLISHRVPGRAIVDLYDSNFKLVEEEIGNSRSFYGESSDLRTEGEYNSYIINNKTAMLYKCEDVNYDSNSIYNMSLVQKVITFENGKYSTKDVMTVKNVSCMQRK